LDPGIGQKVGQQCNFEKRKNQKQGSKNLEKILDRDSTQLQCSKSNTSPGSQHLINAVDPKTCLEEFPKSNHLRVILYHPSHRGIPNFINPEVWCQHFARDASKNASDIFETRLHPKHP